MKVLYITNGDGYAGASIALENIISCLKDKIDIEVVFPRQKGDFSKKLESMGIKCYHFRYTMNVYPSDSMFFLSKAIKILYIKIANVFACRKIEKIVRDAKIDIIHTNVGPVDIGYKVAKKIGIPHVWHLREYINKDFGLVPIPSFDEYIKKYQDSVNTCVCITVDVIKHFHVEQNGVCIYDGPLKGKSHYCQEKKDYFLFVGRLQEAKGDRLLLESFAKYVDAGGMFDLYYAGVGADDRMEMLKQFVKDRSLQNRVFFLGHCNNVYHLMSEARALFVPSRFEGFGFITAEAMYNHCLVVGRNTAGTKEQFDNGIKMTSREIGVRFNKDSEIPSIMLSLEKESYSECVNAAYKTVCSLYMSDHSAEKIYQLYNQLSAK